MNRILKIGLLVVSACVLSSCSVAMAARKEGTNVSNVQRCNTRSQFLAQDGRIVSSERCSSGDLVEVYQYKKERGSAARAFMHGVLDVSTCGLWEVVGTPMEACVDENGFFAVKVTYDSSDNVKSVQLQ